MSAADVECAAPLSPAMRFFTTIYDARAGVERPVVFGDCTHCFNPDGYGVDGAAPYCNNCRRKMSAIAHIPDSAIAKVKQICGEGK